MHKLLLLAQHQARAARQQRLAIIYYIILAVKRLVRLGQAVVCAAEMHQPRKYICIMRYIVKKQYTLFLESAII